MRLPKTGEVDALVRELLAYQIRIDENANDKYGAFAVGSHDDLVTALGLCCCFGERGSQVPYSHPSWRRPATADEVDYADF